MHKTSKRRWQNIF